MLFKTVARAIAQGIQRPPGPGMPANLALSRARAASVKAALISRGIDATRLTSEGFGDTQPVADNATAEGRTQNRRVELVKQ